MKNKFVLLNILVVLALFLAACAAQQEATQGSGAVTALPTSAPGSTLASSAPTEETGGAAMTPTGAVESPASTQGAEGGAVIPQTGDGGAVNPQAGPGDAGLPDDLDEVMRVLTAAGATLELGDTVENDYLTVPGQILNINGEEVQIYTYDSAEDVDLQASQIPDTTDPEDRPHVYRMGRMLVIYTGGDPGVLDLLEDVLGARATAE
jgi:hypothetical protein